MVGLSIDEIYQIRRKAKLITQKAMTNDDSDASDEHQRKIGRPASMTNNTKLLEHIREYLEDHTPEQSTLKKIRKAYADKHPDDAVPCVATIGNIIRNKFHLNYIKVPPANARYDDPTFSEKRLWISRILASMLLSNTVIIALDESSFKSRVGHTYRWRFDTNRKWTNVRKILDKHPEYTAYRDSASPRKSLRYDAINHTLTVHQASS
jgi:hypothetical protein